MDKTKYIPIRNKNKKLSFLMKILKKQIEIITKTKCSDIQIHIYIKFKVVNIYSNSRFKISLIRVLSNYNF